MTLKFHSTILASTLAATLLVGFASAAIITDRQPVAAPKGDRLPIAATATPAAEYVTIETRHDGMSELTRIPLN